VTALIEPLEIEPNPNDQDSEPDGSSPSPSDKPAESTMSSTSRARPNVMMNLGRLLVGLGTLILLFAGFQVWGTGLVEWRAQQTLDAELDAALEASQQTTIGSEREEDALDDDSDSAGVGVGDLASEEFDSENAAVEAAAPLSAEDEERIQRYSLAEPTVGGVLGRIDLPSINQTKAFVFGVGRDDLRRGPGLYPSTPLPGAPGNTAIAGHRTTHGAPFFDIDQLVPGDPIFVETADGRFEYKVEGHKSDTGDLSGHFIVDPSAVEVLEDRGDNRLTLTACNPKYSARERIIVTATLVSEPVIESIPFPDIDPSAFDDDLAAAHLEDFGEAEPASTVDADASLDETLGWQMSEFEPALLWGLITMFVGFLGWVVARFWRPRVTYALTMVMSLAPLFTFFVYLDRLMPAL